MLTYLRVYLNRFCRAFTPEFHQHIRQRDKVQNSAAPSTAYTQCTNDISRKIDCKELSSRVSGIFHSQINFYYESVSCQLLTANC